MTQLEFTPLRILEYKPNARQSTAHQTGVALCEDGMRYFVKGMDGNVDVCATEWVSNSIAHDVHLPVPSVKVLQSSDGKLVFGSQGLAHKLPDIEVSRLLLNGTDNILIPELNEIVSATYALDQLIGNDDRHVNNFLVTKSGVEQGQEIGNIRPIDFGNANLLNEVERNNKLHENSNTVKFGRQIRKTHGFSERAALGLLNRIKKDVG